MLVDHVLLAQLLALSGMVAATAEYSAIIRRRAARRLAVADQQVAESGLQGLVRVFLAEANR